MQIIAQLPIPIVLHWKVYQQCTVVVTTETAVTGTGSGTYWRIVLQILSISCGICRVSSSFVRNVDRRLPYRKQTRTNNTIGNLLQSAIMHGNKGLKPVKTFPDHISR
jgi:hypothetical protein